MSDRVATVVLNYLHADDTIRCIASVQKSQYVNCSIVVVDNGSGSDVMRELQERLDPVVPVIDAGENLGYAAGNNLGIRKVLAEGADLVWLLNPDTVVEPDTLGRMAAVMRRYPQVGIVGTRILNGASEPPSILFNGGIIDWVNGGAVSHADIGLRHADVPSDGVTPVDYVTGASMLVRRHVFDQIGLIPEDYFLYFEETDFCTKARSAGWINAVDTGTFLWHYKRSSNRLPAPYYVYYYCRGRLLFHRRFVSDISDDLPDDLSQFIEAWRRKVERNAPDWLDSYNRLVSWAIEDGFSGVRGRRDDIAQIRPAATITS